MVIMSSFQECLRAWRFQHMKKPPISDSPNKFTTHTILSCRSWHTHTHTAHSAMRCSLGVTTINWIVNLCFNLTFIVICEATSTSQFCTDGPTHGFRHTKSYTWHRHTTEAMLETREPTIVQNQETTNSYPLTPIHAGIKPKTMYNPFRYHPQKKRTISQVVHDYLESN